MPTKAELQAKINSLNQEQGKSMTYEGLVALIIEEGKNDREWKREFKEQWTEFKSENRISHEKFDAYNMKQNGRQADMMGEIATLKKEALTRSLTCGAAITDMQKASKEGKEEDKVNQAQKISKRQWIALFVISLIVGSTAVGGLVISIINIAP